MFQNKKYILMTASMGLESVSASCFAPFLCWSTRTPEGQEDPWKVQFQVDFIKEEIINKKALDGMNEPDDTESGIAIKENYIAWRNFLALYRSSCFSDKQKERLNLGEENLNKLDNRMKYSWKFRLLSNEVFCDKPDATLWGAFIKATCEDLSEKCKEHIFLHIYQSTHFEDVKVLKCLPTFDKLKKESGEETPSYETIKEALIQDFIQFYKKCEYPRLKTVAKAFMEERSEILKLVRQEYSRDLRNFWKLLKKEIDFWSGDMFRPEEQTRLCRYTERKRYLDLFWYFGDERRYVDQYSEYEKDHLKDTEGSYNAEREFLLSGLRGIQYGGDERHTLELGQTEESRKLGPVDDPNLPRPSQPSDADVPPKVGSKFTVLERRRIIGAKDQVRSVWMYVLKVMKESEDVEERIKAFYNIVSAYNTETLAKLDVAAPPVPFSNPTHTALMSLSKKQKEEVFIQKSLLKIEGINSNKEIVDDYTEFEDSFMKVVSEKDAGARQSALGKLGKFIRVYQSLKPWDQSTIAQRIKQKIKKCPCDMATLVESEHDEEGPKALIQSELDEEGPKALIQDLRWCNMPWGFLKRLNELKDCTEALIKNSMDDDILSNLTRARIELKDYHNTACQGSKPFTGDFYTKIEEILEILSCLIEVESGTRYINRSTLKRAIGKLEETIKHFEKKKLYWSRPESESVQFLQKIKEARDGILAVLGDQVEEGLRDKSTAVIEEMEKEGFWSDEKYEDEELNALLELWQACDTKKLSMVVERKSDSVH